MKNSMNNFTLGDPVISPPQRCARSRPRMGPHVCKSTYDPDLYDVKTDSAILTRLRAGDMAPDETGKRIEATR
jgi:hypothetical protein